MSNNNMARADGQDAVAVAPELHVDLPVSDPAFGQAARAWLRDNGFIPRGPVHWDGDGGDVVVTVRTPTSSGVGGWYWYTEDGQLRRVESLADLRALLDGARRGGDQ